MGDEKANANHKPDTPEKAILHWLLKTQGPFLDRVRPLGCSTSIDQLTADVMAGYGDDQIIYPSSIRMEVLAMVENGLVIDPLPSVFQGVKLEANSVYISPKGIVKARGFWPDLGRPKRHKVESVEVRLGLGFTEGKLQSVLLSSSNKDFRRTFRTVRVDGFIFLLLQFFPKWEKVMLEGLLRLYEERGLFCLHYPGNDNQGVSRAGLNKALHRLSGWYPMIRESRMEGRRLFRW